MTETPWESAMAAASVANSNVDYHRENIRHLKKMQQRAKMRKEAEANKPIKAFPSALTEANKKKFDHVQSRVHEWANNKVPESSGRDSSVKNSFLKGHQKTGPFIDDNDSAMRVRRLSGLKSKKDQQQQQPFQVF
jgi:hypothetical protein